MTPQNGVPVDSLLTPFTEIVKQSGCHQTTVRKTIYELGLSLTRMARTPGRQGPLPVGIEATEVPALLSILAERKATAVARGMVHAGKRKGRKPVTVARRAARLAARVTTPDDTNTPIGELKVLLRRAALLCKQLKAEATVTAKGATINRTVEVEEQVEL